MPVLVRSEDGWEEQGSRNVPSQEAYGNVPSRAPLSVAVDVRLEIWNAVAGAGGAVTRAEIARLVKRKKSTWLNREIEGLVRDGYLIRLQGPFKNGVVMFWYEVAP